MKLHLYTSQSLKYFEELGKYGISSAIKFLPEDTKITITTEDHGSFPALDPRIEIVDLYKINNGFKEFEDRWTGKTMAKVINFAKKGYTVLYALENLSEDTIMVWLDADALFKKKLTVENFSSLLKNTLGAHLGVTHEDGEFTVESGFFFMNGNHSGIKDFARIYRDYYDNDRNENMGRFYDSNVHGHVVKDCENLGHKFVEMNLRQKGNTPLRGSMVESWAAHMKGKAKRNEMVPTIMESVLSKKEIERIFL